jgi:hypothetical protein
MVLAVLGAVSAAHGDEPVGDITHRTMEGYPNRIQASLEQRERALSSLPQQIGGLRPEFVIRKLKRWPQREQLKAAFQGGDSALHKKIADATKDWTDQCNLTIDFGLNPTTGKYRQWTNHDQAYQADIRVSFDQPGYFSMIGTDCVDASLEGGKPNQASTNFEQFDVQLPADWRGVVLHEFGHSLGFEHEHQHPTQGCNNDFRWQDDPSYVPTHDQFGQFIKDSAGRRPGIYTVLGGPPNRWPQAMVDFNLRQLTDPPQEFILSPMDSQSIMKYFFEEWMFVLGAASHCYSPGENGSLSPKDIEGVGKAYPKQAIHADQLAAEHRQLLQAAATAKNMPSGAKKHYENRLQALSK